MTDAPKYLSGRKPHLYDSRFSKREVIKHLTGKSGTGPWLHPPHRTPTPPNMPRPVAKMFILTAICLGAIGVGILFTYIVNDVALDRIEIIAN